MTVRIVQDDEYFWQNYSNYENLVKSCFFYLMGKYPNPEGNDDALNTLLVRLQSLRVFTRWNRARLVFNKIQIKRMRDQGLTLMEIEVKADHKIAKQKVNVDKKFEQYIYKWVEQVLSNAYKLRKKERNRFVRLEKIDVLKPETFHELKRKSGYTSWDTPAEIHERERIKARNDARPSSLKKKKSTRKTRRSAEFVAPTIADVGYASLHNPHPLDNLIEQETRTRMRQSLQNDLHKRVFDLKAEGYTGVDIPFLIRPIEATPRIRSARVVRKKKVEEHQTITPSYVSAISRKIQARCAQVL